MVGCDIRRQVSMSMSTDIVTEFVPVISTEADTIVLNFSQMGVIRGKSWK